MMIRGILVGLGFRIGNSSPDRPFAPDKALHRESGCAGPGRSRGRRRRAAADGREPVRGIDTPSKLGIIRRRPEMGPDPRERSCRGRTGSTPLEIHCRRGAGGGRRRRGAGTGSREVRGPRSLLRSERASRRAGRLRAAPTRPGRGAEHRRATVNEFTRCHGVTLAAMTGGAVDSAGYPLSPTLITTPPPPPPPPPRHQALAPPTPVGGLPRRSLRPSPGERRLSLSNALGKPGDSG